MPVKYIQSVFVLFLLFLSISLTAQQRFKAGVTIGVNAAQINGDQSAGFNKLGLMGGIKAAAILTAKSEFGLEILYSQRGSQSTFFPNSGIAPSKVQLNYVEVPLTYTFMDWEAEDYYRMHFHGGISYGRLINATSEDSSILVVEFSENDFAVLVGFTYFASEKLGLGFRYNRSVIPLFNRKTASNPINSDTLWGFFLTFNAVYIF